MDDQLLKQLAVQKEKEWIAVLQERLNTLEITVQNKDTHLAELNQKYTQVKEDFKYNLKLIDDRDKELVTFDNRLKEFKKQLNNKDSEISDLKIINDQLRFAAQQIELQVEEEKTQFIHRLNQKDKDINAYKRQCDDALNDERQQIEQERRAVNRKLSELEAELDRQRRELSNDFETHTRKLEFEWKKKFDDIQNEQLASELKSKLLTDELEQEKVSNRNLESYNIELNEKLKACEKLIKERDWQLHEVESIKNARIRELELKTTNVDSKIKEREDDFSRKHGELDRLVREKDLMLEQLKQSYQELQERLMNENQILLDQVGKLKKEQNETQRDFEHDLREKEASLSRLQDEINRLKKEYNYQLSQVSKENANQNVEHQAIQEECDMLKGELKIKDNHINRYKKELEEGFDRERALEEAKAQLDIDWQRKFDQGQRQEYHKSENLIEKVTDAHQQALAQVKKLENDIRFKDDLLNAYSNQYKSVSRHFGGNPDVIVTLQRENENLRSVITQMRQQMESLATDLPGNPVSGQPNVINQLQKDNQELRQQNRDLIMRLDSRHSNDSTTIEIDHTMANNELRKNPQLNSYVQSLNNTIASLRTDKMQLVAQVRKLEGRLIQIEKNHDNFQRELRQRQSRIDQLQYQLNADDRRHQTEINSLKQKLNDLDVQLIETRREADEYQKAIIERNADVTEVERKLSEAKLEAAGKIPLFNYGGQEILIQQLQDEIERLTKRFTELRPHLNNENDDPAGKRITDILLQQENDQLKRKLEQATKYIKTLVSDKERLLEISNHLRSQLNKSSTVSSRPIVQQRSIDVIPTNIRAKKDVLNLESKLERLEQLQYALTKQELENRKRASHVASEMQQQQQRPRSVPAEKNENLLNVSGNTITTVASEQIRDLWKVLDNTPSKMSPQKSMNINPQRKALTARQQTRPNRTNIKPTTESIKPRVIRNYNIKDH